jgi:hypothetical protein
VLLSQFAKHGSFPTVPSASSSPSSEKSGDGGGGGVANVAANGAAAVSTTVPAGQNATLSIVFAWYFPGRNYAAAGVKGYGEMLGTVLSVSGGYG